MSTRLRALSQRSGALLAALFGPNGLERDELLLIAALALIARGLWLTWQPGAYLAPGVIVLWIVLPSRRALVSRPSEQPPKPTPKGRAI